MIYIDITLIDNKEITNSLRGEKKMIKGKKGMVAITIVLVLAMVMSIASAGPNVKESLKQHKERLNPVEDKEELQHKEELRLSEPITFPLKRVANELIYDDGAADGCYDWTLADGGFAVRFTPPSYPVNLETARICLCQDWPDSDHEQFAVEVYDDNGIGGAPGTKLGGPVYHTATDWGWCDVDISGLGITINSGGFYIAYIQLTDPPNCEALSYDNDTLYGRSWDWNGVDWVLWTAENYMIRCVVDDSSAKAKWTYMVYLDGDNNLEGAAIDDFMEMSSVGSTSNVNIVVQFDRIPGYSSAYGDWTDCKQFHVTAGMTPTAANALIDLGECNMGDPNTLGDFVDWAMTEFPADNYALVLWNHGDGWKSINNWVPWADDIKDAKDAGLSRGICVDNTNNDYLSLQETEVALTGKYVQLLGYDACLMHMVEVVYQVRTNAGVSVGSEESEPGAGWPYDTILADLTGTPTMSEDALGTVIVDRYMDSYGYTGSETQSAVDNGDVSGLVTAVDNLAQVLIDEINGGHWTQVQQARNAAEEIYYTYYIDLYHFAEKIQTYVPGAAAQAQAQAVMNEVSKMYEAHGTSVPNDHGLSIYYPRVEGDYLASYDNTAFASDTEWDEFLKKYYNPPTQGVDIGVFSNGVWYVDTTGNHNADQVFCYGFEGAIPLVGDINQDGTDDIAVIGAYGGNYRWFVDTNGDHVADEDFWFGFEGAIPLVGDINQDGTDDIVIVGAYGGNYRWFVDTNGDHVADEDFWFGFDGATPLVGDINQDVTDDMVIVGAYGGNYRWFVDTNFDKTADQDFWFGFDGATPLVGDMG
jgi:hypothetical protein